jgi:hypothetical protein
MFDREDADVEGLDYLGWRRRLSPCIGLRLSAAIKQQQRRDASEEQT